MDLSRAFDCIPHTLFLSKLKAYGFSHSACELFLSYYRNRKQRLNLGNCRSEWEYVHKGSAQGPLKGPQSNNMFTNDMLFILDVDVDIYNYADDNTFVCSGYDHHYDMIIHTLLQNVNNVISWLKNNNMKVNPDKFQCIVFGRKDNLGSLKIDIHDILPDDVKILGLHLNFDVHISKLCKKKQAIRYVFSLDYVT